MTDKKPQLLPIVGPKEFERLTGSRGSVHFGPSEMAKKFRRGMERMSEEHRRK